MILKNPKELVVELKNPYTAIIKGEKHTKHFRFHLFSDD